MSPHMDWAGLYRDLIADIPRIAREAPLMLFGLSACVDARIFAHELKGTNVLVNSVDPGWVRTHTKEATRSIEEGVETTIWLATLPDGGPCGQFFRDKQPIAW